MKIQKAALPGAGAVGSYIIWGLSRCTDIQFGVVAQGERAERLKQGCVINGTVYHPAVWTPQEAHGADLLVVALKCGALEGAMDAIRAVTAENTTVMSLMNGVDSEERIADAVGPSHLLCSLMKIASRAEGTGHRFDPETTIGIIFGELAAPYQSERVQAVSALLDAAGAAERNAACRPACKKGASAGGQRLPASAVILSVPAPAAAFPARTAWQGWH